MAISLFGNVESDYLATYETTADGTAGAVSAEWTLVGLNDDITLYVDRATIRRSGNYVKMKGLIVHEDEFLVSNI